MNKTSDSGVVNSKKAQVTLLTQDLCARLPYGLKVQIANNDYNAIGITKYPSDEGEWCVKTDVSEPIEIEYVKPYLRPLSSMTEEEREYFEGLSDMKCTLGYAMVKANFCLKRHLDINGLIPMGLAVEAPEGMYNFNY